MRGDRAAITGNIASIQSALQGHLVEEPSGTRKPMESVFISSPAGINTTTLRKMLADRGCEVTDPLDVPAIPGRFIDALSELIRKCDVFVAIFPAEPGPNIAFELGYAMALGKRVVAFVDPKQHPLPEFLAGVPYFKTSVDNQSALTVALDRVLAIEPAAKPRARQKPRRPARPSGQGSEHALASFKTMRAPRTESAVAALVDEALRIGGAMQVLANPATRFGDRVLRPDFAIWVDDLESSLGNPIIVELASAASKQSPRRLLRYLEASNARTGLLLTVDPSSPVLPLSEEFTILWSSVEDFLSALQRGSLATVLLELRRKQATM